MTWFFSVAYGSSVVAALTSAALTAVYVAAGARELNPVVGLLLARVGPAWTALVRVAVVVGCFRAYALTSRLVASADRWSALVWMGVLVQLVDAGHDVGVAVLAGLPGVAVPGPALRVGVAVLLGAVGAVAFRPTLPSAAAWR